MEIKLHDTITSQEFLEIIESIGWKTYSEAQVNKALEKISNATISQHEIYENGLRVTKFDNGVTVAVNYGEKAADYQGTQVDANNYIILEG